MLKKEIQLLDKTYFAPAFSVFRKESCRKCRSSTHPQLYLKNFILNRREQPAWAVERSSSTIPVFRSMRLNTSPGASFLIFSPTTKARRASESFGNGRLSVKQNRRKERKGKGASGGNAGWQQSTGLLYFIVRVPFVENTKTAYPEWDTQKQDVSIPSTPLRGASGMEKDSPTG